MSTLAAVQVITLLASGLKAGVLFGDNLSVRFARHQLSGSSFVKFQQVQLQHFEKFMPALSGITALFSISWLALMWPRFGTFSFRFVAAAALAQIASLVLALAGCMPINKQLMTWSISSPPPDVMEIWTRWEQINAIRTFLAIVGFVCVVLALIASPAPA